MKLSLNNITYGNPTLKQKEFLSKTCLVSDLYQKLKDFPCPENESDSTKQELNELMEFAKDIQLEDNEKFKKRFVFYDKNLFQAISNSFKTEKADIDQLIKDIDEDITPLIVRLKYNYQRPRPYQLAQYYKLKLFPFSSTSAHSPSYPSGHTIQAYVMLTVIGNLIPEFYEKAKKMIEDVAYSRCYIGVHYPTDNDFAYQVAQEILKHPDFAKKYGI
jgi:hypothetical protein